MIKTILIPLDGSSLAERAIPYAVRLAHAGGGRLVLFHATPDHDQLARSEAELAVIASLGQHVETLRRLGVEAASWTVHGPPGAAIRSVVREHHVDLIVMSTHGRGGIGRMLYGSVADQVIREAAVPVLLVSPACDRRWEEGKPLRIMVPLDGSHASEAALAPARDLGQALNAELWLVRAVEEPFEQSLRYGPNGVPFVIQAGGSDLDEALRYLETVAGRFGTSFSSIDVFADVGRAARVIAEAARREDIDLIVMATHGRTGLARLALGSVATTVLQHAPVPVMLVRPVPLLDASSKIRQSVTRE